MVWQRCGGAAVGSSHGLVIPGNAVVTCRGMVRRMDGVGAKIRAWACLVSACLLAVVLVSCDGHGVVEPPDTGVVWTRLSPASFQDCLWPDVRNDSLVYSSSV